MPEIADLVTRLGVQVGDETLLRQALIHSSVSNERPGQGEGSNERLEFLGDAVLGFVVADEVYRRLSGATEGELTRLRSALVRKESLAEAARRIDLGRWLMLGRGEEASGSRMRDQILASTFEAVVGALFLSDGLERASEFIFRHLGDAIEAQVAAGPPKDPKSELQELTQARWQVTPLYVTTGSSGPDHAKQFHVEVRIEGQVAGEGSGRTKQAAEQGAARQALDRLAQLPPNAPPPGA
ncbi:MAG: ribonuclease III [Dehalococcoidia bacterium]